MLKIANFLILLSAISCTSANADVRMTWYAKAFDKFQKTPLPGVDFTFTLTDKTDGKTVIETCGTNADGECQVHAMVKRGLFSGGEMVATARFKKEGYRQEGGTQRWDEGALGHTYNVWLESDAHYAAQQQNIQDAAAEKKRKEQELAAERIDLLKQIMKAEDTASIICQNKNACDKMFSLTEIYIAKTSDMKIQLATGTTIETHNPVGEFALGISAFRIPAKGATSIVTLKISCKDSESSIPNNLCLHKTLAATIGFRPFIQKMLLD